MYLIVCSIRSGVGRRGPLRLGPLLELVVVGPGCTSLHSQQCGALGRGRRVQRALGQQVGVLLYKYGMLSEAVSNTTSCL